MKAGKIKDGSNIVTVGAGLGFVWASAVVRWGPQGGGVGAIGQGGQ